MADPNVHEQLQLELINRLRTDPGGEYARIVGVQANIDSAASYFGVDLSALQSQLNALTPVAALAWNSTIADVAETHSALMIQEDTQSHQLPGEASLGTRLADAGYQNRQAWAESIYAFADDDLYGHAGFVIDWGYDDADFDGNGNLKPNWQSIGDGIQDPAGHRNNMMSSTYTEIGIDVTQETNSSTQVGEYVITQDFATRFGYQAQFVGVVIDDTDNDDFYDIGEGMGGISVALSDGTTTYNTVTWASGGWQIEVPAGTYTLTFSGGALSGVVTRTATLGSTNVKVDIEADDAVPSNSGDDTYVATAAADNFDGGAGSDTASYAVSTAGVTVRLVGNVTQGGFAAGDTLVRIENLAGSNHADTLEGNGLDNILSGGDGSDILLGAGGSDSLNGGGDDDMLDGGGGGDQFDGGGGDDTVTYAGSTGAVTVDLDANAGSGGHAAGDTFASIEHLIGSRFADTLTGKSGSNTLMGGAQADTLQGLGGADQLFGGTGGDMLEGGAGGDALSGQGGRDTASYATSTGAVTIDLTANTASGGHAAGDTFTGIEDIIGTDFSDDLKGTSVANTLDGGAMNDTINGAAGADTIHGGAGDDELTGGGGADTLNGDGGSDTASYLTSTALVQINLLNDTATGGHANGDDLNDIENVFGSRFNDVLVGDSGNNTLNGHTRNDSLEGGLGDDTLTGGTGSDTFVFTATTWGQDTITDFQNGRDKLDFTGAGLSFADFTETASGGGTLLELTSDTSHSVFLEGISTATIDASDFL